MESQRLLKMGLIIETPEIRISSIIYMKKAKIVETFITNKTKVFRLKPAGGIKISNSSLLFLNLTLLPLRLTNYKLRIYNCPDFPTLSKQLLPKLGRFFKVVCVIPFQPINKIRTQIKPTFQIQLPCHRLINRRDGYQ